MPKRRQHLLTGLAVVSVLPALCRGQDNTWLPVGGGHHTSFAVSPTYAQDGRVWAAYTVFPTTSQAYVELSTDRGESFGVQSSIPNSKHIKEIAISPTFASDQTLYQAQFRTGMLADELMRSTDAGATWTSANLPNAGPISTIRLSPDHASDQTLFANRFTYDRLHRSTNGGQSWTGPTQFGLPVTTDGDVAFAAEFATSQVVHAWSRYENMARSSDGGLTFTTPPTTCAVYFPYDVEAAPIGPGSQRIVFASGQGGSPFSPAPGLYRSVDDGLNYTAADTGIPIGAAVYRVQTPPDFATSGRVYVATDDGVYYSDDYGLSYAPLPAVGLTGTRVVDLQLAGGSNGDLYARVATATNTPGQLYRLHLAGTGLVDTGHALAGTTGLPQLWADVPFAQPLAFDLQLTNALPNTLGVHVIGLNRIDFPFAGGVLVPDLLFTMLLATDTNGAASAPLQWLPGDLAGTTAFAQTWLLDPAGPAGFASSNGLQLRRL